MNAETRERLSKIRKWVATTNNFGWPEEVRWLCDQLEVADKRIADLERQLSGRGTFNEGVEAALKKYGQHLYNCDWRGSHESQNIPCTCGLDDEIRALKRPEPAPAEPPAMEPRCPNMGQQPNMQCYFIAGHVGRCYCVTDSEYNALGGVPVKPAAAESAQPTRQEAGSSLCFRNCTLTDSRELCAEKSGLNILRCICECHNEPTPEPASGVSELLERCTSIIRDEVGKYDTTGVDCSLAAQRVLQELERATAPPAASVDYNNFADEFIASMKWIEATEYEKTLVICNVRGFASFLSAKVEAALPVAEKEAKHGE